MQRIIIIVVVLLAIAVGAYFLVQNLPGREPAPEVETPVATVPVENEEGPVEEPTVDAEGETTIGTSAGGRDITAYRFGTGETELLFVGGIHGGYSWNTALVAYELVDYLEENPEVVPENVRVTVVPVLNPDGLEAVVGTDGRFTAADVPSVRAETIPGRFNANTVDLNRNFDCDWQESGTWQDTTVDGGSAPFSEPESQAIRDYVAATDPDAVVVWYSAAGGVFASSCHNDVLPETRTLTTLYAEASGYRPYESFDFYAITGDMVNWLAREKIPAISVLLTTHSDVEWEKNRAGIDALLERYAE